MASRLPLQEQQPSNVEHKAELEIGDATKEQNDVRRRALLQYIRPYSSACLRKMAATFSNGSIDELEKEIINLICDGHLQARIDARQKIVYTKQVDAHSQIFERAIEVGNMWQKQAKALICRRAILKAGIRVDKN